MSTTTKAKEAELLTVDETAAILRTSPYTVRRLLRNKEIRAVHVGNRWRVNRVALMRYAGIDRPTWEGQATDEGRR